MKRLHWPLIFIALFFTIPFLAAALILNFVDNKNLTTVQHGSFIQPQQLQIQNITYIAGEHYENKWSIVYLNSENCKADCEAQKQILYNLHVALGAERERVAIINASTTEFLKKSIELGDLFIRAPNGLYIMRYSGIVKHTGLLKDIRRLLKYSHAK